MEVAYTNHIGRSSRDKHSGKDTAIHSISDLAAVERHNNHDYTAEDVSRMQSAINLDLKHLNRQYEVVNGELVEVAGRLNLESNVRKIYQEQFQDAVNEHNLKKVAAGHPERQIQSYIEKISRDKQQEVAVEGMIQFGCYTDWEGMAIADREKVAPLLLQSLQDTIAELKGTDREFVLAGASIHLNEGSPHLHYVGVPVLHTPDAKNGLSRRVNKSAVFTREALSEGLQDHVREKIAPQIKALYGWDFEKKKTGRNKDLEKNVLVNENLKGKIRVAEQHLGDVNAMIHATHNIIGNRADAFANEALEDTLFGQGVYESVAYLMMNCDDDRLNELVGEGQNMMQEDLTQRIDVPSVTQALDDRIAGIINGTIKVRKLSWEQRQEYWEIYSDMAKRFWSMREDMQREYEKALSRAYQNRRKANRCYHDAMYFLNTSRSWLGIIISLVVLVVQDHRRSKYNDQIDLLREMRSELIRDTKAFATNSKHFRNKLKAGEMPGQAYMDAMADAIKYLEVDFQMFLDEPKKQLQHLGDLQL